MTFPEDRWYIQCPKCMQEIAEKTEADYINFEFHCTRCGNVYAEDDVNAFNPAIGDHYRRNYTGAKVAGIIPEKEFEGDREQRKFEPW